MTDRPTAPTDTDRPTADRPQADDAPGASTDSIDRPPTDRVDQSMAPTVDRVAIDQSAPIDGAPDSTGRCPDGNSSRRPTDDHTDREPWSLRVGLTGALWILSTVASLMASAGQVGFAEWAGLTGLVRFGVPVILDMFDVVLLLLGYRQGRRKRSPYPLWTLAILVGAFGFYTNVVHAGDRAGLIFGAASAVTLISWLVKLRIDLTKYLERIGAIPPGRPKFGRLIVVAPRVALHAWTVTVRRRVTSGDLAVECAETWIMIADDTYAQLRKLKTGRRAARRLARRTAWHQVFAMTNGPKITVPAAAEVQTVDVTVRSAVDTDAIDDQSTGVPVDDRAIDGRPVDEASIDSQPVDSSAVGTKVVDDRSPSTVPARGRRSVDSDTAGAAKPTIDRSAHRLPSPRSSTKRAAEDRPIKAADIANAGLLRTEFYSDGLPADATIGTVRGRTEWSFDRAKYAMQAYRLGLDLDAADQGSAMATTPAP